MLSSQLAIWLQMACHPKMPSPQSDSQKREDSSMYAVQDIVQHAVNQREKGGWVGL
jgi:hypothetical protein